MNLRGRNKVNAEFNMSSMTDIVFLLLIFFILIIQFNSVSKPGIIMLAIFLSLIGVFGGLVLSGAPFVIMMTMVGIIALAGIVVNNGVVLLDYAELLISRRKLQDGVSEKVIVYDTEKETDLGTERQIFIYKKTTSYFIFSHF